MKHPLIERIEFLPETPAGGQRARTAFPHLSGSQLSSLSRCGLAYFFGRKIKIQEPLTSPNLKGSAFHEGIGAYLDFVRKGAGRADALTQAKRIAVGYLKDALGWTSERPEVAAIVDFGQRWPKGPCDTTLTIALDVAAALEHVAAHPFVQEIAPLSIERGYVIYWADQAVLPLVGYTDLAYTHGLLAGILDWKTGAYQKGEYALGMDLAQVGYAFGASADLHLDIDNLTYGTLSWQAPRDDREEAEVSFALQTIPFEPTRITRLFARCAEASRDLHDERYRMGDSEMTCPTCPFREPCSARFGALDASVLDSATFFAERAAEVEEAAPGEIAAAVPANPNGPSEKQRSWILTMLRQANLALADAMTNAGLSEVEHIDDLPRNKASKIIDYLKPVAEQAVKDMEVARRIDRQIAQARAMLAGLDPEAAEDVCARCGCTVDSIATAEAAHAVMAAIGQRYAAHSP